MAKVSVIIPVYNGAGTIRHCIDSVTAQTLEDIEIIVVDDCSTDGTFEIIKSLGDKRIKTLRNSQNVGQGITRNVGIFLSSGKYLGFVDADDTIEPQMYEKMYEVAEKCDADIVQCGIRDIRGTRSSVRTSAQDEVVHIADREEYAQRYINSGMHSNEVCNKILRKTFLEKHNLKFSDTRKVFSEDLLLNIRMMSRIETICFVKDVFYNYYISEFGHCRSDVLGRIEKMCTLFETGLQDCDRAIRPAIEEKAAQLLISYISEAMGKDEAFALDILKRDDVRSYIRSAVHYHATFRFAVMAEALLYGTDGLRKFMLRWCRHRSGSRQRREYKKISAAVGNRSDK